MIRVPRPTLEADTGWRSWWTEAKAAIDALVNAYKPGEDVSIDSKFYQAAKPFLLSVFNHKCAYCETVISAAQPGDVEHYRPKGRIRTREGIVRMLLKDREVDHPGYWWLAYNWSNLLPSCADCNRRRQHEEAGMAGKADYFEIRGKRATGPKDPLDAEQALLLDPSSEGFDATAHFKFNADGSVDPLTDDAKYSCELLGLNLREKLVAQRREAYVNAQRTLMAFINSATAVALNNLPEDTLATARSDVNNLWDGRAQYSAFTRAGLDAFRQKLPGLSLDLPLR